jgi:hypothetical protein
LVSRFTGSTPPLQNPTPYAGAELALELEPLIAAKTRESYVANVGRPGESPQKSAEIPRVDTRVEVARAASVSHDTIARAKVITGRCEQHPYLASTSLSRSMSAAA